MGTVSHHRPRLDLKQQQRHKGLSILPALQPPKLLKVKLYRSQLENIVEKMQVSQRTEPDGQTMLGGQVRDCPSASAALTPTRLISLDLKCVLSLLL